MPKARGSYAFYEAGVSRLRAFYPSPSSFRASFSATVPKHTPTGACHQVLAWAWQRHTDETGELCPYPELSEFCPCPALL